MLFTKFYYNRLSLLFAFSIFAIAAPCIISADVEIVRIESLSEIKEEKAPQTLYLLDIDDTLIDSPCMLGNYQWRQYMKEVAKRSAHPKINEVLSLFVARKHPIATVEAHTAQYVHSLYQKGYPVCGFTARERNAWYDLNVNDIDALTVKQLNEAGIYLNPSALQTSFPDLTIVPEYYQGIIFSDIEEKGAYLKKLFADKKAFPKKVIFIDDKKKQIESVYKALKELGIEGVCYWYCATVEKANRFNPLIANIQLDYFIASHGKKSLNDEDAAAIVKQYPEKDAEYYLQRILSNAEIQELTKP